MRTRKRSYEESREFMEMRGFLSQRRKTLDPIMSNQIADVFNILEANDEDKQHFLGMVDTLILSSPDKEKLKKTRKLIQRILNNNQHNLRDNDINTDEVQVLIDLIRPLTQQDIQSDITNLLRKMLTPMGLLTAASFISDLTNESFTVGPAVLLLALYLYTNKPNETILGQHKIKELAENLITKLEELLQPSTRNQPGSP